MRLTQVLRASAEKKPGVYTGPQGASGTLPQKGIIYYGLSMNRSNPTAGMARASVFNTFRRTRNQILYWGIPAIVGYEVMQWAIERNEYLNSKEGRAEFGEE